MCARGRSTSTIGAGHGRSHSCRHDCTSSCADSRSAADGGASHSHAYARGCPDRRVHLSGAHP
jgi:hypothetical protein